MSKINLSQEERNIIYQEELKKRQEEFKKAQKEKLDSIPEEERRRIFEEESIIKVVEVDSSIIRPSFLKEHKKILFIIVFIIGILLSWRSFILGFILSFIIAYVGGMILSLVWDNFGFDIVEFKCPYCGEERRIKMTDNIKEDNNSKFPHVHFVYVKSNASGELKCIKCNRTYEFRYTYLNK